MLLLCADTKRGKGEHGSNMKGLWGKVIAEIRFSFTVLHDSAPVFDNFNIVEGPDQSRMPIGRCRQRDF